MLATIEFDNEPGIKADKIRNEGAYGHLAAKLEVAKSPVTQRIPKLALRLRHARPQRPGTSACTNRNG